MTLLPVGPPTARSTTHAPSSAGSARRRAARLVAGATIAGTALAGAPAFAGTPAGDAASAADTGANPAGCVTDWQGEPLFQDQFKVQYADNYTLTYFDNYKVLSVREPSPGAPAEDYVLVQCGTELPAFTGELADAQVVQIPVQTLFSGSSSHLGFIDALGVADRVTGINDTSFVVMPSVRERVDAGDIISFAPTWEVDAELVLGASPDVFVTGGTDDPAYDGLIAAGVPVLANAEWLETSPKGWAEWVGFFAALTNTEATANELFEGWVDDYDAAAELAASAATRPTVITGSLYEGDWYARGGQGIVPRFIADAGGAYLYADDTSTGSLILDIETVIADGGADADVWIAPVSGFNTRDEAVAMDSRYGEFAAWERGGVWINDGSPSPEVSLFEVGPINIGPYLRDYVKLLHPELAADHEFVFFRQLALQTEASDAVADDTADDGTDDATPATTEG